MKFQPLNTVFAAVAAPFRPRCLSILKQIKQEFSVRSIFADFRVGGDTSNDIKMHSISNSCHHSLHQNLMNYKKLLSVKRICSSMFHKKL